MSMVAELGLSAIKGSDWVPLDGFPGLDQIVLSGWLDGDNRAGRRTRLVRFQPGGVTTDTLVHEYFEETYLVSGDLAMLEAQESQATAPSFVFRPPGTRHGPFVSKTGCVMLEVHYFV